VESVNVGEKNERPLLSSLLAAAVSFDRRNVSAGLSQLTAFQTKVRAQIAPSNPTLAAELMQFAEEIINALN
jgi:hypothetical protein